MAVKSAARQGRPKAVGHGRYVPQAVLHQGQAVPTFRCRDTQLGLERTLWVIPLDRLGGRGAPLRRFEVESRTLTGLVHPNLAAVQDAGVDGDHAWLVVEQTRGGTLEERLTAPLPPRAACDLVAGVLAALQYGRDNGVSHLALCPRNVLLTETGVPKVSGLGLGRLPGKLVTSEAPWLAPEQRAGQRGDAPADVFAVGMLLLFLITGEAPQVPEGDAERYSWIKGTVPAPLVDVLMCALAHRPEGRPSSPEALAEALRAAAAELPAERRGSNPLRKPFVPRETPLDANGASRGSGGAASEETVMLGPDAAQETVLLNAEVAQRAARRPATRATWKPGQQRQRSPGPTSASTGRWWRWPLMALAMLFAMGAGAAGVLLVLSLLPGGSGSGAGGSERSIGDVLPFFGSGSEPTRTEETVPPTPVRAEPAPRPTDRTADQVAAREGEPAAVVEEAGSDGDVATAGDGAAADGAAADGAAADGAAADGGVPQQGGADGQGVEAVGADAPGSGPDGVAPDTGASGEGVAVADGSEPPLPDRVPEGATEEELAAITARALAELEARQEEEAARAREAEAARASGEDLDELQMGWTVESEPTSAWHRAKLPSLAGPHGRPDGATLEIACTGQWITVHIFGELADAATGDTMELRLDGEVQELKYGIDRGQSRLSIQKAKRLVRSLRTTARLDVLSWDLASRSASFRLDGIDEALRPLESYCAL